MAKGIYRFNFDCGRQGTLTGIFIAEKEHVKTLIDNKVEVYFGEVLGKHSEIYGNVEESELTLVSENEEAIKIIEDLKLETGYNPFHYSALSDNELTVLDVVKQMIEGRYAKDS